LDLRIRYQSRSPRQGSESDRSLDAGIVSARVGSWVGTNFKFNFFKNRKKSSDRSLNAGIVSARVERESEL
jgi:hypothetical protein